MSEPLKQYKIRVIDPISPTYCAAKWLNATIWLGHGQTTSCHHPPGHRINEQEITENPSAIHNTQHKKLMRKLMLEGKRPNECEYCWKVEDVTTAVSDRTYKTQIYKESDITNTTLMPWDADVMLKTLEISFDRTCNFACSYCNPAFSTTWVKDIRKNGPYQNIVSDGRGHYTDDSPWAEFVSTDGTDETNPYIQAFWKWWNSGLSTELEEIRITGGEPLMSDSVWKLFQWFRDNPGKNPKLRFAVNSNLVPKDKLIDKLIEQSHFIPHLEIYTSNESKGAHADYLRDGMDYATWLSNLTRLATEGNIKSMHIMMTINSLCLASITEFMDDMIEFKLKHGAHMASLSLNILRFPSFQSVAILPEEIKHFYKVKLEEWFKCECIVNSRDQNNQPVLNDWERAHIQRLIDYLDVVKTPHANTAETPKLYHDFRSFYEQYDHRRNKNFRTTFPGVFRDFIDSINFVDAQGIRQYDPATTESGYESDEIKPQGWDVKNDRLGANE